MVLFRLQKLPCLIRHVIHFLDKLKNLFPCFFPHISLSIDHIGHCRQRNSCYFRNIFNTCHDAPLILCIFSILHHFSKIHNIFYINLGKKWILYVFFSYVQYPFVFCHCSIITNLFFNSYFSAENFPNDFR